MQRVLKSKLIVLILLFSIVHGLVQLMVHIQMEQIRLHRLDLIELGEVEEVLEFVEFRVDGHETVTEEDLLRQIARSDVT